MQVKIPQEKYITGIEINGDALNVHFAKKKKVALLFISLNEGYWPYLAQVIKDCRAHFLPQHHVDYFVWTDYNEESKQKQLQSIDQSLKAVTDVTPDKAQEAVNQFITHFFQRIRLLEVFYPALVQQSLKELKDQGIDFKREGQKFWVESARPVNINDLTLMSNKLKQLVMVSQRDMDDSLKGVTLTETGAVEWPAPTLMRYNLFLQQEEKLKEYDHIFYMDADMRVVAKVSDEILSKGLTAAPHPGYALASRFIPPYEPNPESTAYIKRLGQVKPDENGVNRFIPFYAAGGFQGGATKPFLNAMRRMKKNIDRDFDRINYTAIWNDESHWNKYLWNYRGPITFLDPSYVYPDSLIKEFYEPIWGRNYEPKIITLTKPFTLSAQAAQEIQKFMK